LGSLLGGGSSSSRLYFALLGGSEFLAGLFKRVLARLRFSDGSVSKEVAFSAGGCRDQHVAEVINFFVGVSELQFDTLEWCPDDIVFGGKADYIVGGVTLGFIDNDLTAFSSPSVVIFSHLRQDVKRSVTICLGGRQAVRPRVFTRLTVESTNDRALGIKDFVVLGGFGHGSFDDRQRSGVTFSGQRAVLIK